MYHSRPLCLPNTRRSMLFPLAHLDVLADGRVHTTGTGELQTTQALNVHAAQNNEATEEFPLPDEQDMVENSLENTKNSSEDSAAFTKDGEERERVVTPGSSRLEAKAKEGQEDDESRSTLSTGTDSGKTTTTLSDLSDNFTNTGDNCSALAGLKRNLVFDGNDQVNKKRRTENEIDNKLTEVVKLAAEIYPKSELEPKLLAKVKAIVDSFAK